MLLCFENFLNLNSQVAELSATIQDFDDQPESLARKLYVFLHVKNGNNGH